MHSFPISSILYLIRYLIDEELLMRRLASMIVGCCVSIFVVPVLAGSQINDLQWYEQKLRSGNIHHHLKIIYYSDNPERKNLWCGLYRPLSK